MPYIKPDLRAVLDAETPIPLSAGELNYCLTRLVKGYVEMNGVCYTTFNTVIGALECAKQEFYRRVVVPYEDEKCQENGDVYK